jgi:hypothetical protein
MRLQISEIISTSFLRVRNISFVMSSCTPRVTIRLELDGFS